MGIKLVVFSVGLAVSLAACNPSKKNAEQSQDAPVSKPVSIPTVTVDLSSPDRTLKTLFALQDLVEANRYNEAIKTQSEKEDDTSNKTVFLRSANQLFDGLAKQAFDRRFASRNVYPLEVFEREILKITNETETRSVATVNIKNVTPLSAGAVPSEYDKKRRTQGKDYQYVLTKTSQGWKIEDIKEWDYEVGTYRESFVRIYQLRRVNDGPSVPSLTSPYF